MTAAGGADCGRLLARLGTAAPIISYLRANLQKTGKYGAGKRWEARYFQCWKPEQVQIFYLCLLSCLVGQAGTNTRLINVGMAGLEGYKGSIKLV